MSIKPIRFTTDEVRATLGGRKTVTRRVVRGAWPDWSYLGITDDAAVTAVDRYGEEYPKPVDGLWAEFEDADGPVEFPMVKTPYRPGDILYVRETWAKCQNAESYVYKADFDGYAAEVFLPLMKWRPSIHMPREAARIWLRVTGVRVEQLQEIDADGIRAEGLTSACVHVGDTEIAMQEFALLWDSTIKPADRERYGWAANPFCWVIEFERCEKPKDA